MFLQTKNLKYIKLGLLALALVLLFLFLRPVFRGDIILSPFFHIGSLRLQFYGLIMALAMAIGYWQFSKRAVLAGETANKIETLTIVLIISGFIGARIYHIFSAHAFYAAHPLNVFYVWNGGLGIFGAIIGGLVGLFAFARYYHWSWEKGLNILDWLAPSILIGQIIGRFGNLFNYELFGPPTNVVWKMYVPLQFRPGMFASFSYFHPLFLYESVINVLILFGLYVFSRKFVDSRFKQGTLFVTYVFLYTMERFFIEHYRIDSPILGGLRFNNIVSLALLIIVIFAFYVINHRKIHSQSSSDI